MIGYISDQSVRIHTKLVNLPGIRNTADVHAADSVPPAGSSEEHLCHVQLSLWVLKLCSLRQVKLPSSLYRPGPSTPRDRRSGPCPQTWRPRPPRHSRACIWVGKKGVCGLRGQEGELGCDAAGAGRAAEQAAELTEREAIHPSLCKRRTRKSLCWCIQQHPSVKTMRYLLQYNVWGTQSKCRNNGDENVPTTAALWHV